MRLWVVLLALSVPVAGASSTMAGPGIWNPEGPAEVRLHFHLNGPFDFPINTQEPAQDYQEAQALGLATHSQGCVELAGVGAVSSTYHTYYGYSSPGEILYEPGHRPVYAPERGLTYDARLDPAAPPVLDWYLQTGIGSGPLEDLDVPLLVPEVTVLTTWREGDQVSVSHHEFNTGRIIAHGQSPTATLSPFTTLPDGITHMMVDGRHVYHFRIPLEYQETTTITASEGMNVRIDVRLDFPCGDRDQYIMPDLVRPHTSDGHRPGMDIQLYDAVRIDHIWATFDDDVLVGRAGASSPFGPADIAGTRAWLLPQIADGDVALEEWACRDHSCSRPGPKDLSWKVPVSGRGHVVLEVSNLQGTATAHALLGFDVGSHEVTACQVKDGEVLCANQAPPPAETTPLPLWSALLALGAVHLGRRRT